MRDNVVQMKDLMNFLDHIDGWLTYHEQLALVHIPLLVEAVPGEIVEIGSYKGKSTIALAFGSVKLSQKKRPVYAIDPFRPHYDGENYNDFHTFKQPYFESFRKNIAFAGLQDHVKVIKKFSTEAYDDCPNLIAALFIDGDHRYESIKHDISHYLPRVAKGGIIAFHDYRHSEHVTKAVDELCLNSRDFVYVAQYENSLLLVRKLRD